MAKQKIGILGTGVVGKALGKGFTTLGHEVKMGSREPNNPKGVEWATQTGALASAGTFAEVAKFGDVVVLATAWTGTENALKLAGADALAGKVLIDTTNPLVFGNTGPALALGFNDSAGEQVQRWVPKARVVKAFNIVGNTLMFRPDFKDGPPDMFIGGDDADAKQTVTGILKDFGWGVIDAGGIQAARHLEPMAMIWISYFGQTKGYNHAFKLLRK